MTHIGGMHIKLEMKQMKHYVRLFGETDRVFLYTIGISMQLCVRKYNTCFSLHLFDVLPGHTLDAVEMEAKP